MAPVLEESFELSDLEAPKPPPRPYAVGTEESALTAEEEKLLDELETELEPEARIREQCLSCPRKSRSLRKPSSPTSKSATGSRRVSRHRSSARPRMRSCPSWRKTWRPAPRTARDRAASAEESAEVEVTLSENGAEDDQVRRSCGAGERACLCHDEDAGRLGLLCGDPGPHRGGAAVHPHRPDQLRRDLSGLRKTAAERGGESPSAAAGTQGGFFDEDEDETIALTGDELDNILNTAEITEEAAESPSLDVDVDLQSDELTPSAETPAGDILSYETPSIESVEERKPAEEAWIWKSPKAAASAMIPLFSLTMPSSRRRKPLLKAKHVSKSFPRSWCWMSSPRRRSLRRRRSFQPAGCRKSTWRESRDRDRT